jgi:hypothetical protein
VMDAVQQRKLSRVMLKTRNLGRLSVLPDFLRLLFILFVFFPTSSRAEINLASDFAVPADGNYHDVPGLQTTIFLNAGKSVYIYAIFTATSNTTVNMLQGAKIVCGTRYVLTTQNHTGSDSYSTTGGKLKSAVRFLFTAATDGSYTCKLQVVCSSSAAVAGNKLTLKAGADTSIDFSIPQSGAGAWGTENDFKDSYFRTLCPPTSSAPCDNQKLHIGPGMPAGTAEYSVRSARWQASIGASGVDAIGDTEITVCYNGSLISCSLYAYGPTSDHDAGSTIDTRLLVQQMPSATDPNPCAVTYEPPIGFKRTNISTATHHQKIFHSITNLPFNTSACGSSRYFVSKVEIRWVSGNPIRVEAGNPGGYSISILKNR